MALDALTIGPFTLSRTERAIRYRGELCALAPKAIDLLAFLASTPNAFVSNDDLIAHVWPNADVYDANLTQTIYMLRTFFRAHGNTIRIENLPKRGYRLIIATAAISVESTHQPIRAPFRWRTLAVLSIAFTVLVAWRIAPPPSTLLSASAMDTYLIASHDEALGTPEHLMHAAALFARVEHLAPHSPLGFAGASEAATSLSFYASTAEQRARLQADAITSADAAFARDPESAEAYAARGAVKMAIQHDELAASLDFQRAIHLNPREMLALIWEGTIELHRGEVVSGRALIARAVALAPDVPGTVASLAWADFLAGDNNDAIALSRQMLRANQFPALAYINIANANIELHRYRQAREAIAHLPRSGSAHIQAITLLARIDVLTHHRASAIDRLTELNATLDPTTIDTSSAIALASAYRAIGDTSQMRAWLARVDLMQRPALKNDPRFAT